MKVRIGVLVGAIAALGVATAADAAPSPYKVTGGGQTFLTADAQDGVKGPGDTITFQAFIPTSGEQTPATGQVNIIDRGGEVKEHFRGTVQCAFLETDGTGGGYAELHGVGRKGDDEGRTFVVRIRDNGQGAAAEDDLVDFELDTTTQCEDAEEQDPSMTLARGNAKIHKENSGASKSSSAKSKSSSTTTQSNALTSALTLR
jgi:hypothetical protein